MSYLPPIEFYYEKAEEQLISALPPGPIWDNNKPFINLLKAISRAYARAERESDRHILFEIHPESTFDFLTDLEDILGLPIPGEDFDNQSLSQRRNELNYWLKPVTSYTKDEIKDVFRQYLYKVSNVERIEPFSVNSNVETNVYDDRWDYVIELALSYVPGHAVGSDDTIDYTELKSLARRIFPIPFIPFVEEGDDIRPPGPPLNVRITFISNGFKLRWTNTADTYDHVLIEMEHPTNTHETEEFKINSSASENDSFTVGDVEDTELNTRFNLWSVRSDGARSSVVKIDSSQILAELPTGIYGQSMYGQAKYS